MSISSLLASNRITTDADISSKKRLLEYLAEKAANQLKLEQSDIYNQLLERERLGSTGLGQGIAVPHARLNHLEQPHACLVKLKKPIAYDALDKKPVDLVFTLLVPEASTDEHLQILSSLARLFSNQEVCEKIRQSETADSILEVINQAEQTAPQDESETP